MLPLCFASSYFHKNQFFTRLISYIQAIFLFITKYIISDVEFFEFMFHNYRLRFWHTLSSGCAESETSLISLLPGLSDFSWRSLELGEGQLRTNKTRIHNPLSVSFFLFNLNRCLMLKFESRSVYEKAYSLLFVISILLMNVHIRKE